MEMPPPKFNEVSLLRKSGGGSTRLGDDDRAAARPVFVEAQREAMQSRDRGDQAQTQSVAGEVAGAVAARKALEDRGLESFGQAGAGVGDSDFPILVQAQFHRSARRGEFDGVVEQI